MGIVNLQAQEELLSALTEQRPLASLPFGGRYRLIDFPMSCMVNSGIRNVGVLLPEHSRSILDHLRSGKDWDLARHHKGLFYLPPVRRAHGEQGGDLQNMYSNLDFVDNSSEEYVLLAESSAVYNMDFTEVMETHFRLGADITMVTSASRCTDSGSGIVVRAARDGVVSDVCLHSDIKKGEQRSLGIYFMRKQLFVELVRQAVEHGGKDFRVDVLLRAAAGCRPDMHGASALCRHIMKRISRFCIRRYGKGCSSARARLSIRRSRIWRLFSILTVPMSKTALWQTAVKSQERSKTAFCSAA